MLPGCPSEPDLVAFHRGLLADGAVDAVAQHLETCPRCEAVVQRLDESTDPLMDVLRKHVRADPTTVLAPGLAPAALDRLEMSEPDPTARENWPVLPGYEVLAVLGQGGMGVVYKARHFGLNRLVALKRLPSGADPKGARSRLEAKALANLHHPNIVQIYEVIEHEGCLCLALELVAGGSLAAQLHGKPLPPRDTARLLELLARAVHHAHARGIIHRDLKPANILLQTVECGGRSDEPVLRSAIPKVSDFGLAKRLAAAPGATRDGDILGTPGYMAPEQAAGRGDAIGPATDVYSLGVILYEMLTGRIPLQGPNTFDTLLMVCKEEPVPPRRLQPHIARDLETICLKCLAKEGRRRYGSAAALADDLHRFLRGEPIVARPTPGWERVWKWTQRRPLVAGLSAALVLVAVLGFGLVAWQWRRAEQKADAEASAKRWAESNERQAQEERRRAERLSARALANQGIALCEKGEVDRGLLWLARALELADRVGDADLVRAARCNLAGWQALRVRPRAEYQHEHWVWDVALSPDGRTALTGSIDGTARLWDVHTGQPQGQPLRHEAAVRAVAFSPDGRRVLTGSGDPQHQAGAARLWDAPSGQPLTPPLPHPSQVEAVAFSPDCQSFLTVCKEQAQVWRTADGRPVSRPMRQARGGASVPTSAHFTAVFSPDGRLVATGGDDRTARLWDAATGVLRGAPLEATGPVLALAFSPDGQTLASGNEDGGVQLWEVGSGRPLNAVLRMRGRVRAVAFSPDGAILATGGSVEEADLRTGHRDQVAGEVRLWQARSGKPLGMPLPHGSAVWSLAFTPGGRVLLTGAEDRFVRFFLTATGAPLGKTLKRDGLARTIAVSPDGTLALTASVGALPSRAALWELPPEALLPEALVQESPCQELAFSPDGRSLLTAAADPTARLWDLTDGRRGPRALPHEGRVRAVAFSPDGQTFLTSCQVDGGGVLRLWDRATGRVRAEVRGPCWAGAVAFSPDGQTFLAGGPFGVTCLRETATGQTLGDPFPETGDVETVAFSPDGQSFLTAGEHGARLWGRSQRRPVREWPAPNSRATGVLHPDGNRAFLVFGGFARGWDLSAGRETGPPPFHPDGQIQRLALSLDGRSILISNLDQVVWLWDVATGLTLGPPRGQERVTAVSICPNGRTLAVGGADGRIALWEVPRPVRGTVEQVRRRVEVHTRKELDDQGTIHDLSPDAVEQRQRRLDQGE